MKFTLPMLGNILKKKGRKQSQITSQSPASTSPEQNHAIGGLHLQDIKVLCSYFRDAVYKREPFSFIRIGDGEGTLLALEDDVWIEDIQYFGTHFGFTRVRYKDLSYLRDELRKACTNADLVGIREDVLGVSVAQNWFDLPPPELAKRVRENFRLRTIEHNLAPPECRRLALTSKVLSELAFAPKTQFASAWLHWDMVISGCLYQLLEREERIGIITSRCSLPALIEEFFSVKVNDYAVPDRFISANSRNPGEHFPRRFEQLKNEISVDFPGMLFLVGAGLCGKVYCNWIKQRGGIALDIGSVMDAWIGLGSRPRVLADRFAADFKQGQVPDDLLLNRRSIERILERAATEFSRR